jgi:addiction module HigA family antidote
MCVTPRRTFGRYDVSMTIETDYAIHPGGLLAEELEVREISPETFAAQSQIPLEVLNEIIGERTGITEEIGQQLESALGISAEFWRNLQLQYEETLGRLQRNMTIAAALNAGLCTNCGWTRIVESVRGSHFHRCGLSDYDAAFPRYPRLPVGECAGYSPIDPLPAGPVRDTE